MKVAVGSDHAGFEFKEKIQSILRQLGYEPIDFGTNSKDSVDYPDFALKVARSVAAGEADYGITICWSGNGMAMAANKVNGIRAGLALSPDMAYLARLHNNANVLSISQKWTPEEQLEEIVRTFLTTEFEGGRHAPRVEKIQAAEHK